MLRRLALAFVVFLPLATGLAACGEDEPPGPLLQGTVWEWQGSHYSDGSEAVPDDPSSYTIEFADDGTAAIKADCNQVGATYEQGDDDGSLTIELGPSTKAACPPDSLDTKFLDDLSNAAVYFFGHEGELGIDTKGNTAEMVFGPSA